jgi:hypothetical protein
LGDPSDDAVVVAAECIESEIPGVVSRRNEGVDDGQSRAGIGGAGVFQTSHDGLAMWKAMAVEESAHFQLGIESRFEATK